MGPGANIGSKSNEDGALERAEFSRSVLASVDLLEVLEDVCIEPNRLLVLAAPEFGTGSDVTDEAFCRGTDGACECTDGRERTDAGCPGLCEFDCVVTYADNSLLPPC